MLVLPAGLRDALGATPPTRRAPTARPWRAALGTRPCAWRCCWTAPAIRRAPSTGRPRGAARAPENAALLNRRAAEAGEIPRRGRTAPARRQGPRAATRPAREVVDAGRGDVFLELARQCAASGAYPWERCEPWGMGPAGHPSGPWSGTVTEAD
ncbi:hypothetical protein [Streptomyces solicathayae]|uniref:Uncharacterized protein n=1 Tax=Streptomyces solicathayae TaxID=3081768 RepID=A0ABZ0M2K2_9ACTN|nr:hypothetical protein [Streptomyces sp. HUAS YS2]WOX25745.1 hypothetical protein R2D22_31950 [Streptomyces sp. HUAS YS2]